MTDQNNLIEFQQRVWNYYKTHKRSFPWRETTDPYAIIVSELMLQQTQTDRVVPKYLAFLEEFPTVEVLAKASLTDVLKLWQGLGYNRRALYLMKLAQKVVLEHGGKVPNSIEELDALPGIGYATACAVYTYSYNLPSVFIETNIRTVFIHHFFADRTEITDREIEPLVAATVAPEQPREWYYALMDYGVMLKKTLPNPGRKSAHYSKQSSFLGSDRKIRGEIVRLLLDTPRLDFDSLYNATGTDEDRLRKIVSGMIRDGIVSDDQGIYSIPDKE